MARVAKGIEQQPASGGRRQILPQDDEPPEWRGISLPPFTLGVNVAGNAKTR